MKYFIDTEFHEDGVTIDLISIGIVCEDGRQFYAVSNEFDVKRAMQNEFLVKNVLDRLGHREDQWLTREEIKDGILNFVGMDSKPEFWSYFADYDWVAVCQLFGRMKDLPDHFPYLCLDLRQTAQELGISRANYPAPPGKEAEHNALSDALWHYDIYVFLENEKAGRVDFVKTPNLALYEPHKRETWSHRYATIKHDLAPYGEIPGFKAGDRVKIVMVSRFGDFGITLKLNTDVGYERRVEADELTDWGVKP